LKQCEEKYNSLKSEKINAENKNNDIENLIEKNNAIIKEKHDLENEIKKINSENKVILDEIITSKSDMEKQLQNITKENEKLQEKIKQLTILQDNYENQLNTINIKYKDIKKTLTEKEKELSDLKEVSQALIQKEKTQLEKSINIDPNKCKIISDKKYKNLTWYLIYEKKKKDGEDNKEDYINYRWVDGSVIKRENLEKFNKFESDEQKIKDLKDYNLNLTKKLEAKEESFSKLDYQNKKLIKELHNKTAGNGLLNPLSRGNSSAIKNNTNNNTSIDIGSGGFKNILAELNDSNIREKQLQNTIIELNNKLKQKDSNNSINNNNMINNNENQKKIENNTGEQNNDEVKLIQDQMKFLKEELKEVRTKYDQLVGQVKELLKNVKCDNKNKPQFVQICQILGLSPQTTSRIITNNNKKALNF
jgi:DNA repair exonuclease SbcCD ATPase subunit